MARHHVDAPGSNGRTWIAAITARRANERLRANDTIRPLRDDHDGHTLRELSALLEGTRRK